MMTSRDFQFGYWQDVPKLISQVDTLYSRLEAKGKLGKVATTKKRIYEERGWEPSRPIIEKRLDKEIAKLNYFYVPKGFLPGPLFVFPQKDLSGKYPRAQSKPLYQITNTESGISSKYRVIGVSKENFHGPVWLGNDLETLQDIIETRSVMVVEGSFDLLAARLVAPTKFPILSPLTKKLGRSHILYLRMLGVETLYVMFDNERGKFDADNMEFGQKRDGAGNFAMKKLLLELGDLSGIHVEDIQCPGKGDPSDALTNFVTARQLKQVLHGVRGIQGEQ